MADPAVLLLNFCLLAQQVPDRVPKRNAMVLILGLAVVLAFLIGLIAITVARATARRAKAGGRHKRTSIASPWEESARRLAPPDDDGTVDLDPSDLSPEDVNPPKPPHPPTPPPPHPPYPPRRPPPPPPKPGVGNEFDEDTGDDGPNPRNN